MPNEPDHIIAVVGPPRRISARPAAIPVRPKTPRGPGQGRRRRWREADGTIYEWDYDHGTVEVYDSHGNHQGEIDPITGETTKGPKPGQRVEP
jgi:Cytotoxic